MLKFFFIFSLILASCFSAAAQSRPIVLKAGTVLDGKGGSVHNTIIVVEDPEIVRVGGDVPENSITYDLSGLTVTPSWIDTHSHILWHFDNGRLAGKDEPPVPTMLHPIVPSEPFVHRHSAAVPRVPSVTDLSPFDTMGVVLLTRTTKIERIWDSEKETPEDRTPSFTSGRITSQPQLGGYTIVTFGPPELP